MSNDQGNANTDREIWREREHDYYADSIHVTQSGGIGINCGGGVIVKPLRAWFELGKAVYPEDPVLERAIAFLRAFQGAHDIEALAINALRVDHARLERELTAALERENEVRTACSALARANQIHPETAGHTARAISRASSEASPSAPHGGISASQLNPNCLTRNADLAADRQELARALTEWSDAGAPVEEVVHAIEELICVRNATPGATLTGEDPVHVESAESSRPPELQLKGNEIGNFLRQLDADETSRKCFACDAPLDPTGRHWVGWSAGTEVPPCECGTFCWQARSGLPPEPGVRCRREQSDKD